MISASLQLHLSNSRKANRQRWISLYPISQKYCGTFCYAYVLQD